MSTKKYPTYVVEDVKQVNNNLLKGYIELVIQGRIVRIKGKRDVDIRMEGVKGFKGRYNGD